MEWWGVVDINARPMRQKTLPGLYKFCQCFKNTVVFALDLDALPVWPHSLPFCRVRLQVAFRKALKPGPMTEERVVSSVLS